MVETLHLPTKERTAEFNAQGLQTDELGRPIHPWIAARGKEFPEQSELWQWGPNAAADAIVFNQDKPQVLLIQRRDGTWASAGGFIDATDKSPAHAAAREAWEEERIRLDPAEALPVYEGIVADTRSGKYSWTTSAAFLWRTSIKLDTLSAGDDAQGIRLANLAKVSQEELSGSHQFMIQQAIERYGTLLEKTLYFANRIGDGTQVADGHMSYNKRINFLPTHDAVFIKKFAPAEFTDKDRAARSLLYLQKEADTYKLLKNNEYPYTPEQAGYYDGLLVMEALLGERDWTWRHPKSSESKNQYIADTFEALGTLSEIALPQATSEIKSSFVSFAGEGWDMYDYDSKQKIIDKLHTYACEVQNDELSNAAYKLSDNLDDLRAAFCTTDYDQPMVMCHHDFRESNFAWHPQHGVKIIDWSWAGPGLKNSDATTFLIDLHKRGVNVAPHMERFNKDHALMMIGFWLMHSTWPPCGNTDVRFQQMHSAVAAYSLLGQLQG